MPDGPVTIRLATDGDVDEVSRLLAVTWHATYDAIWGVARVTDLTTRWHAPDRLAAQTGQSGTTFLVAVDRTHILGTALARRVDDAAVMLDRLYVHPEAQGRGIGRALLDHVVTASDGASRLFLDVAPENARAIAFYERHGFAQVGLTDDCEGDDDAIPALVMCRDL